MSLLASRRFGPLFVTQALGALNDNLFKNALALFALFHVGSGGPVLVAVAGGVFLLPYALFSGLAGQLADAREKAGLIRLTKFWELGLMLLAGVGFLSHSVGVLMAVLFGLGMQATFFSPLKYGILPDHLAPEELSPGNGLIEAGTFISILIGTLLGGLLIGLPRGVIWVPASALVVAVLGIGASWWIPRAPSRAPSLKLDWNLWRDTINLLRRARMDPKIWFAILGISWFWALGGTLVSAFPVVARQDFGAGTQVVTAMLAVFAVGVGIGSIACARLGGKSGVPSLRVVAWSGLAVSVFMADFAWAARGAPHLASPAALLSVWQGWRLTGDLLLLAVAGGAFSVPLYVRLQVFSPAAERARMIAANNVMNALATVLAAGLVAGLFALKISGATVLLFGALGNLLVAGLIFRKRE